jgi:large subunit ribosomal protein L15
MKHIGNLSYAPGSRHKKKRVGRGAGSGHGGTATRGHKGHQSRSNFSQSPGFEGGQMSLKRRIPKFGFTNINRIQYQEVNVAALQRLVDSKRVTDGVITPEVLFACGVISKKSAPVKVLGNGDLSATLNVTAAKFSAAAQEKITKAGGAATVNG